MAAHRYFRGLNLQSVDRIGLEISELQLYAGASRVDGSATLTALVAPSAGSLAALKDDDVSTVVAWSAAALAGLVLKWDFGSGGSADVSDIRVGSGDSIEKYLFGLRIQYSDDDVTWTTLGDVGNILWPGRRSKTSVTPAPYLQFSATDKGPNVAVDSAGLNITIGAINSIRGTVPSNGLYPNHFEITINSLGSNGPALGVATRGTLMTTFPNPSSPGQAWVYYQGGSKGTSSNSAGYGAAYVVGDTVGVVHDPATGNLTFYKNGVSQGVAYTLPLGSVVYPVVGSGGSVGTSSFTLRTSPLYPVAGALPWSSLFPIPRGYYARATDAPQGKTPYSDIDIDYGRTLLIDLALSRSNFLTDPGGAPRGRVRGTVKEHVIPTDLPVARRVRLVREVDGMVVREVWSRSVDGAYDFQFVDETAVYSVLSYDHTHNFRAVIADNISRANGLVELMP